MDKAIAKVGRDNHINLLISRLPVLTFMYAAQCYIVFNIAESINFSDFVVYMGAALIGLVSLLFIHDKYHHVLIYEDHLLIYFEPLRITQKIHFKNIVEIVTPAQECEFSSILLKLDNNQSVSLYFVDFPVQVKSVIEQLQELEQTTKTDSNKAA